MTHPASYGTKCIRPSMNIYIYLYKYMSGSRNRDIMMQTKKLSFYANKKLKFIST